MDGAGHGRLFYVFFVVFGRSFPIVWFQSRLDGNADDALIAHRSPSWPSSHDFTGMRMTHAPRYRDGIVCLFPVTKLLTGMLMTHSHCAWFVRDSTLSTDR